ncbi:DUF866-domain-containing protein [Coemansia reversa NRRL 1564]|uniref:DUF866-domain-containing protein n=1 Tax=Coemansia reversa (strain ATCC 12441 / NRRL 1564) TaxID=763665 RepID=A0A2G5B4M7_COERN|nr:DUF866-domain-containing protein [Coemansia reversa NRRL 1564]|eukprot:PIA13955.1 DUF866-domain-containing protein [Coemansia reversa NRRL 1564]
MAIIDLQLKAELLNVTGLIPNEDKEAYNWHFKIQCGSCQEITKNFVTINRVQGTQISGSRGGANLVMKCKYCKREGSASIVSMPIEYTDKNNGKFASILSIECRGLEPVEFEPRDGWRVVGTESQAKFDVDLTEGEWYDYDEDAGVETSVTEIKAQFVRAKHPAKDASSNKLPTENK